TTSSLPLEPSVIMPFTAMQHDQTLVGRYHGAAAWRSVSPGYFDTFQIQLLRGRTFSDADDTSTAPVAIMNRAMMRKFWPEVDANPIGEFVQIGKDIGKGLDDPPRQIIGVVADQREAGLNPEPMIYVPVMQVPDGLNARNNGMLPITWVVRSAGHIPLPRANVQEELRAASG